MFWGPQENWKRYYNFDLGHPWLPDDPSPLIQTLMPDELKEALVAGLIDQQMNEWDPHILSDLFEPEDVARISRILISSEYEDSWYWLSDPGAFDKWVSLWKLKVPPKWKTFLWRALCDILPTTSNLIIKRVDVNPTCSMCDLQHEDVMHSLVLCEYSRLVWNVTELPITNILANSFPIWLMGALNILTEEQCGQLVAVLYYLWNAQNTVVWEGTLFRAGQIWRRVDAAMHTYAQLHRRLPHPLPTSASAEPEQVRPRCFVDAGYRPSTGEATIGVVLLSQTGSFQAATNGQLPGCFSPLMAEALACNEALS
ncbi:PREDICTED: uncharacterized protein LOC109186273 [Ipomoea nil]|uniref:uncharacterized protein LOC109186273 n=1 Tax=Ipomoea nil TaxID=35883 RepID=UPI0009016EA7|nr:PREDICTED: uncharacterized protein LOC109186273 [Ipomoea nil]